MAEGDPAASGGIGCGGGVHCGRVIGYEPDRGSLYRTFLDLKREGALVVQQRGSGRSPTLYRKTIASDATAAE